MGRSRSFSGAGAETRRHTARAGRRPSGPRALSLRPQDLVLDLLGWYIRPLGGRAWSGGLVRLLSELGFSTPAARVALGRLVQRGLLSAVRERRLVYYETTARLEAVLAEGDRRIRTFGREIAWDGRWTFLWYAIPGDRKVAQRRLARRLRYLGFGSPQEGTWIAPRDRERELEAVIDELDLRDYVAVVIGRMAAATNTRAVVAKLWDVHELDERYQVFLDEFSGYRSADAAATLTDAEAFRVRTRAVHEFRRFPSLDPLLPEDILGKTWKRPEVVATFHELEESLRPAAMRYFEAANTPPGTAAERASAR